MRAPLLALLALLLAAPAGADIVMTEVTNSSFFDVGGAPIDIIHCPRGAFLTETLEKLDNFGPGVVFADLNRDGWYDLIMGNGNMENTSDDEVGNYVLLNNGDGTFVEVSWEMGMNRSKVANGICGADIDNDGYLDFMVGNFFHEPQLFVGGRTRYFEDGESYGVRPLFFDPSYEPPQPIYPESMGVVYGDYNSDGYVDLYVANHRNQPDLLFKNMGGGYLDRTDLVEVTSEGFGFQAMFLDFDNDLDQDIYVANDFGYNFLFDNQGPEGNYDFEEMALPYRCAGGDLGEDKSMGMGLAVGDYDNDLDLDIYVTNYYHNALFENRGVLPNGLWKFYDVAPEKNVDFEYNCWGVELCDLDLDGDLDLVHASGFIGGKPGGLQEFNIPDRLYRNEGPPDYVYTEISDEAGFNHDGRGRGLATADYDRDGDLDIAVAHSTYIIPKPEPGATIYEGRLRLYRNDQNEGNHGVALTLQGGGVHEPGVGCNFSAIGCRVYLTAAGQTQMREVQAGASFLSQSSMEVEFGVGQATVIDEVRVRWLCGAEEIFDGVAVDRVYRLIEGQGHATPLPVLLSNFSADPMTDGIRLSWSTAPGIAVVSTRVYRSRVDERLDAVMELLDLELSSDRGQWSAFDDEVDAGHRYAYRLSLVGEDGFSVESPTIYASATGATPGRRPVLGQNFPNPFNPTTTILFELPRAMEVTLSIVDSRGHRVRTLLRGPGVAGENRFDWDGHDDAGRELASGVYGYMLETPLGSTARRLVLVR